MCPPQPALCLSSRCPSFPSPFRPAVLGQGTSAGQQAALLLLPFPREAAPCLPSPGSRFPRQLEHASLNPSGGGKGANARIQTSIEKRNACSRMFCCGLYCRLLCKAKWGPAGAGGVQPPPLLSQGSGCRKANQCCCSSAPAWPCPRAPGWVAGGLPRAARLLQASW